MGGLCIEKTRVNNKNSTYLIENNLIGKQSRERSYPKWKDLVGRDAGAMKPLANHPHKLSVKHYKH